MSCLERVGQRCQSSRRWWVSEDWSASGNRQAEGESEEDRWDMWVWALNKGCGTGGRAGEKDQLGSEVLVLGKWRWIKARWWTRMDGKGCDRD